VKCYDEGSSDFHNCLGIAEVILKDIGGEMRMCKERIVKFHERFWELGGNPETAISITQLGDNFCLECDIKVKKGYLHPSLITGL